MAFAVVTHDDMRAQVAAGVGRLATHLPACRGGKAEVGETFEMYRFDGPVHGPQDFGRRVHRTGMFHHQVFIDGKPVAIAVSVAKDGSREVVSLRPSGLARAVDEAVSMLDATDSPGEVRLLTFSAYNVTVLWVVEGDRQMIYPLTASPGESTAPRVPLAELLLRLRDTRPLVVPHWRWRRWRRSVLRSVRRVRSFLPSRPRSRPADSGER